MASHFSCNRPKTIALLCDPLHKAATIDFDRVCMPVPAPKNALREIPSIIMISLPPLLLAHGALGIFDELFLLLALGLFVVMLAAPVIASLLRRGGQTVNTPLSEPIDAPQKRDQDSHFRLD